jgi:hypothetical protein
MIRPTPNALSNVVVLLAVGVMISNCRPTEGGLLLKLIVEAPVRADCLVITTTDQGVVRSRSVLPRQPMKTDYFVGVARGGFPATLTFQAAAFEGVCSDETEWKLASRSAEKTQSFPKTGVEQFELTLGQPDSLIDSDRDTYVDVAKGGTDCVDTDPQVNPAAMQVCDSPVDTNCDGKLFCNDSSCSNTDLCLKPPTGLVYETELPTLVASDCSGPIVVQSVSGGMPAAVTGNTTLTLLPTGIASAGFQLFSDEACTMPVTGLTVPFLFATSRTSFSFRAPTAGSLTLTASSPGLGSTALNTTITDRPIASLSLTPMALSARASACSSEVRVTALDDRGMPTNAPAAGLPLAVGFLPAGTNSVTPFTDASCMTPGVPSLAAGTSSTQLFLRGTRATPTSMPITVQLSSPTVNGGLPAALDLSVTAGDAQRIEFTATVLGLRNRECSMVSADIELLDADGNVTTAGPSGVTITLSYTPPSMGGSLEFFSTMNCSGMATTSVTIPANASRVGLFVRADGPGRYGVTATADGLAMPTAQLQADVATMPPTALVFPSPQLVTSTGAGTCSPSIRLQTRETNSTTAPVSPVPTNVTLSLSPSPAGAITFFSDSNCMTAVTTTNPLTQNAGSSEVTFYFRGTLARDFTVSASASGLATTAPAQNIRVTPAPTSKLVFQPPTTLSALADGCSGALGLVAFDTFNNPTLANGTITPTATPSVALPAGVAFSTTGTCGAPTATVAMVDGGVTFFAKAQRAQQYTISATGISSSTQMSATFTVDAGPPSMLRVVTQPPPMLDAAACAQVQVERLDGFTNPSPHTAQSYTVSVNTPGVASVHPDATSCASGAAGSALGFLAGATRSTFYVRGRTAGTTNFTLMAGPVVGTTNNVVVLASAATQLRFATGSPPPSSSVGVCAQATVQRFDAEGNITNRPANLMVTVTASGAASLGGLLLANGPMCGSTAQASLGVSFGNATARTFSYEPRATGVLSFDVTGSGLTAASGSTTVGAGGVARVRFVSPPTMNQPFASCVPLTLEALDVGNNRVGSATNVMVSASAAGAFFTSTDCSSGMTSAVTVPAGAPVTFRFRPGALGGVTLTATPTTGLADTAMFTVVPGAEAGLVRGDFMGMTTAGQCVDFTVLRVDSGMNPAVGATRTVTVTLSGPASMASNEAQLFLGTGCTGAAQANPGAVNIPDMMSSATFSVRARKTGTLTVSTTSAPLTAPTNTTTTVVAGALSAIAFSTTPPLSLPPNTCSPVVTVSGTDTYGNPAALGTQPLSMANGFFSLMADCSAPVTQLAAGTATTASFHFRNSTVGSASLTVGTNPVVATQNWNIQATAPTRLRWKAGSAPPATLTRFSCSTAFRVQVADAANATTTTSIARPLSFAPAAATGFRFFTDSACTTAVTGAFGIAAGQSESPDLFALSFANGSFSAIATDMTAMPLAATPATSVMVSGGSPAALTVSPTATDLLYRTCLPVTIRRTVGGTDFSSLTTTVNLTVGDAPPSNSYSLHLANDCSDVGAATLSGVVIGAGSSTALVFLRGHSAEPMGAGDNTSAGTLRTMTVIATDSAGFFTAGTSASIAIHPAVRRGTCSIENAEASSATSAAPCTILPALPSGASRRSFFTIQAVGAGGLTAPSDAAVQCALESPTPTALTCRRVGTGGVIDISWQLVSMADAVVLPLTGTLSGAVGDQTLTLSEAVPSMDAAFVLYNTATTGSTFAGDDASTAELATTSTVILKSLGWTATMYYSVQVVQLPGVVVDRGTATFAMPTSLSGTATTTAPGASNAGFALHSLRFSAETGTELCKFRVRSVVTNDTTLTFSRALSSGSANCNNATVSGISWERPSVPNALATVVALPAISITGNTTDSAPQNLGPATLALDRVWTFVSGQGAGGQCGGETDVSATSPGFSQARTTYSRTGSNTRVGLVRGAQGVGSNSTFSLFALTFAQ